VRNFIKITEYCTLRRVWYF